MWGLAHCVVEQPNFAASALTSDWSIYAMLPFGDEVLLLANDFAVGAAVPGEIAAVNGVVLYQSGRVGWPLIFMVHFRELSNLNIDVDCFHEAQTGLKKLDRRS
jgi:hypothetical protein